MQFQTVAYSEKDGILHVKLNRPEKRNAMNQQLVVDVAQCITEVATRPSVHVVLLSGEGKGFSAGTDLTGFSASDDNSQATLRRGVRRFFGSLSEIELLEKPVIALIHGFCYGAALELALACDFRICTPEVTFNLPEVNMGIVPDGGGSQRLTRVVGVARAKELALLGRTIDAQKAEKWGLVNEIVKPEDLEKTGLAYAQEAMHHSLTAIGLAKRNLDMTVGMSMADAMEITAMAQTLAFSDPSFLQRIQQRFQDKVKNKKS